MAEKINYRAVLKDLKDKQKKLGVAIEAIEDMLSSEARERARNSEAAIPVLTTNGHGPHVVTMPDAVHTILKQAGKALHASEIAERLNSEYGKDTHANSVAARLPQDKKHRFENIGNNNWILKEWPKK